MNRYIRKSFLFNIENKEWETRRRLVSGLHVLTSTVKMPLFSTQLWMRHRNDRIPTFKWLGASFLQFSFNHMWRKRKRNRETQCHVMLQYIYVLQNFLQKYCVCMLLNCLNQFIFFFKLNMIFFVRGIKLEKPLSLPVLQLFDGNKIDCTRFSFITAASFSQLNLGGRQGVVILFVFCSELTDLHMTETLQPVFITFISTTLNIVWPATSGNPPPRGLR